jgi:plasmid stability protein
MAELIVREVEPAIVAKLRERAERHCRSVEEEHRAILRDTLLGFTCNVAPMTFEEYLRKMPDVGTDADFNRIEGVIREVDLTK